MSHRFYQATETSSLPPGAGRSVEIAGRRLALFNVDGKVFAIDDDCPHRGGPLGAGWFENGKVHCPLHGWAFDVKTGGCDVRPERPVATHPVEIRGDQVWIGLLERGPTAGER